MKKENPRKKVRRKSLTETKQILLLFDSETKGNLFCSLCDEAARMISPLFGARLLNLSTREIYRLIERGDLHALELEDKQIFVCLNSLRRAKL